VKGYSIDVGRVTQEQRNKLAGCLFEVAWIKDKKVTAVTPRPEFKHFFDLRYEGLSHYVLQVRPRGDRGHMQYLDVGFYPVEAPRILLVGWRGKLPAYLWPQVVEKSKAKSLRSLAEEYSLSREAVRRVLISAQKFSVELSDIAFLK
jgi:hypothetical protein